MADPEKTPMTSNAVGEKSAHQPWTPRAVNTAIKTITSMGFDKVRTKVEAKAPTNPFPSERDFFTLAAEKKILMPIRTRMRAPNN